MSALNELQLRLGDPHRRSREILDSADVVPMCVCEDDACQLVHLMTMG